MFQNEFTKELDNYITLLKKEKDTEKLDKTIKNILRFCQQLDIYPTDMVKVSKILEPTQEQCYYFSEIRDLCSKEIIYDNDHLKSILYTLYAYSHSCITNEKDIPFKIFEIIKTNISDEIVKNLLKSGQSRHIDTIPASLNGNLIKGDMIKYETGISLGSPVEKPEPKEFYTIYYGTNRKPKDSNDHSKGYGNKRSDKLHLGSCDIHIPEAHKHQFGEIKGSITDKLIHLDLSYGDIRLKQIKKYEDDLFWDELNDTFSRDQDEALIFIHGYNNSFKSAAIRAAQMGHDLKVKGATAFFSWPSKNRFLAYTKDETSIEVSIPYIKKFIISFAQKSGAKKVHIIAHSMGNRGLLNIIEDIQNDTPSIKFGQIVLAAPDVDKDVFLNIAHLYPKLSERTTLYVSPTDKAVWLSKVVHGAPRVGLTPPVTTINGIDTVKVNLNIELFDMQHSYVADAELLLYDIDRLLKTNDDPSSRLRVISTKDYWTLS